MAIKEEGDEILCVQSHHSGRNNFLFFCTEATGEPGASIIAGGLGVAVTVLNAVKLA